MKKIEIIKNIALIVLFFTTMLFLYSFWDNPIDRGFNIAGLIGRGEIEVPSFEDVTVPRQVVLNSGEGTFSVIEENKGIKWKLLLDSLRNKKNVIESVDEINKTQYDLIMEYRSISWGFAYSFPVEALIKYYGIQENVLMDPIDEFTTIAYSSGSQESIFLHDERKDKFYRIVFKEPLEELNQEIKEVAERTNYDYYKLGDAIGTDNETIVPIGGVFSSKSLIYQQELSQIDEEKKKEFAKYFFGESLDFVRQIKGSKGGLTFMYGYGEKVLTISSSGKLEYRNNESPQGLQQNYIEALEAALKFVAYHGGWKTGKGIEMNPYVREVTPIEVNKQKGYSFVFGLDFAKDTLYSKEGGYLAVDIVGSEVTRYHRDMIVVEEDYYYDNAFQNEEEIYSIVNAIAANYIEIANALKEKGVDFSSLEGEEIFEAISERITYTKNAYLKDVVEDENVLIPVWAVHIGDGYIFFDLFTGKFLGTSS